MNTHELAWAAGLFDGEGHVAFYDGLNGKGRMCRIFVSQADTRVLQRFRQAVGVGRVGGPYPNSHRPLFQFYTSNWRDTQAVVAQLWKYLSPVKREQAAQKLRAFHRRQEAV